jgi:hypothetical protein
MLLCIANLLCIEMHAWMKFTSYLIPFVFDNSTNFFVCSIPVTGILSGLTSPIWTRPMLDPSIYVHERFYYL